MAGWQKASEADVAGQRQAEHDFVARRNQGMVGANQQSSSIDRVPERPRIDPALDRARARAQAEIAAKQHSKITKQAARVLRHKILTQPYEGGPQMMDLLNRSVRKTLDRECTAQDYRLVAQMGRTAADDFLAPNKLSDSEAVVIMQFMNVQQPPIWPDGNAWLVCMDILHLENIIRPTIFNQPVEAEPEPEKPEKCPFAYGTREQENWDRQRYRREFNAEINPEFRRGAASLQLVQDLQPADMQRLMVAFENMRLPLTAENVRKAGIKLYGEHVTNLTGDERTAMSQDREMAAMSSEDMKRTFGYVASYDPNKGRQAVRQ